MSEGLPIASAFFVSGQTKFHRKGAMHEHRGTSEELLEGEKLAKKMI